MSQDSCAKNEERLQKKARESYLNLFKEEKEKKQQYCCKWYKNPSADEKGRLVKYRKNIIKWKLLCVTSGCKYFFYLKISCFQTNISHFFELFFSELNNTSC